MNRIAEEMEKVKRDLLAGECKTCACGVPAVELRHLYNTRDGAQLTGVCGDCADLWPPT